MQLSFVSIIVWLLAFSTASAQKIPIGCRVHASYPTQALTTCSLLIASGKYSSKSLGRIHLNRGRALAHPALRQHRLAILDFDRAIALGVDAFGDRAKARLSLVLSDLRKAARSRPNRKDIHGQLRYIEKGPFTLYPSRSSD